MQTDVFAMLPDNVPSAAGVPKDSGSERGFRGTAVKNAGAVNAPEEESGRQHGIKKEDGASRKKINKQWEERFNELAAYKDTNGNCNVPRRESVLRNWVYNQRKFYRKGKLSQDRITSLEGIGFNWGARKEKSNNEQWEERFEELVSYREANGNFKVPRCQGQLGNWVHEQRKLYKKGKLLQDRATSLEGIGFIWSAQKEKSDAEQWEKRFDELVSYREANDNCKVPRSQGQLGNWVYTQRQFYKKGKLSQDRIALLEGIGFVWKLRY